MLNPRILFALLLVGVYQNATANNRSMPVIELIIGQSKQIVSAEVAATPSALAAGLMHRQYLPENSGMLFIFPQIGIHAMWMKNTHIPLSVAFIDAQGIIINIVDMEPHALKQHHSAGAASFALEMNQGWFDRRSIKAGDAIRRLINITQPDFDHGINKQHELPFTGK